MQENSTFYGILVEVNELSIPPWLTPEEGDADHNFSYLFIRIANCNFFSFLRGQRVLPGFNSAVHGPRSVKMNIRHGQFYTADLFEVYHVEEHNHQSANEQNNFPGDFPLNDHIYITMHLGNVYSSPLRYYSPA